MSDYITIDGGTTNTRISLVSDRKVIDTMKCNVGARKSIDNKTLLIETIKNGIHELLQKNQFSESNITKILASGMITSELGLINLPHITAPAGISELHSSMHEVPFTDISSVPFVFMRGVKTNCTALENADMMRGEETELMGIFNGEGIYLLPGSHSKIITVDSNCRILDFKTMLTGEMIYALSEDTILKDCVNITSAVLDEEYLLNGYEYCKEHGTSEALFKVRILKTIFSKDPSHIYSFYMGIILCSEIQYLLSLDAKRFFIGGAKPIKEALCTLLQNLSASDVIKLSEEAVAHSTMLGMIKIYEYGCEYH